MVANHEARAMKMLSVVSSSGPLLLPLAGGLLRCMDSPGLQATLIRGLDVRFYEIVTVNETYQESVRFKRTMFNPGTPDFTSRF